jgi:hypothetical protein
VVYSRLWRVRMEEQVGDERLQPRGREAVGGPTADEETELTEETNLERACHLATASIGQA